MAKPVLVELLRFIAANEDLPRTLKRYAGYDRNTLGKLIDAAADRVEELEKAKEPTGAAGSKVVKVRKASEVEKAARQAQQDLDEAMNLSKVERDRLRAERAAQADLVQADGIHPTKTGVAMIVEAVGPSVLDLIERATAD